MTSRKHTPEQARASLERKYQQRHKIFNRGRLHMHSTNHTAIPPEVEADRQRRSSQESVPFGDPPPGRSALAAKQRGER